jgi:hypothetical protein
LQSILEVAKIETVSKPQSPKKSARQQSQQQQQRQQLNTADACGRQVRTRYRTTKPTNAAVSQSETSIAQVTKSHICVCCCSGFIPTSSPSEIIEEDGK